MKKITTLVWWSFPPFFYFILFLLFTYPAMRYFSTHLYADTGDGLQNLWNLWWVDKATELHESIWQTTYLFAPSGTTLVAHALSPLKGYLSVVFLQFFSLLETYNAIVIITFVLTGFTAFLLIHDLTKSYWTSIVGGFIFSFSNYHFAHLEGHLNVISFEWIPLFVLFWIRFVKKPSIIGSLICVITLSAILLSDYYYFFYTLVLASLIWFWRVLIVGEKRWFYLKNSTGPLSLFFVTFVVTAGVFLTPLASLIREDSLVGAHEVKEYSLDLLSPIIPGGHWRFADLTRVYWSYLPGNVHETSVHLGVSVLLLCLFTWRNRQKIGSKDVKFWFISLAFFWILSLGPVVQVWGRELPGLVLPYGWLEKIFPILRLSGVPIRMMVMVTLSVTVISGYGLAYLFRQQRIKSGFLFLFLIFLFLEYLPKPITLSQLDAPIYINLLKNIPGEGIILDLISDAKTAMYYQTIHNKPIAGGALSRIPKKVVLHHRRLLATAYKKEYKKLCADFQVRYIVTDKRMMNLDDHSSVKTLFQDKDIRLYELICPTV